MFEKHEMKVVCFDDDSSFVVCAISGQGGSGTSSYGGDDPVDM